MKKFLTTLFIALGLAIALPSLAVTYYVNSPTSCPSSDATNFPGQSCVPNNICGAISGIAQCYNNSLINPPNYNTLTESDYGISPGYGVDCYAATTCNNPICQRNNTYQNVNHKKTGCTAHAWGTAYMSTSCTNGYLDCDGNPSVCEVQVGVTAWTQPHSTYLTCSTAQCASGYQACNGDTPTANGCNYQTGVTTCTAPGGGPGVIGAGCSCVALPQSTFLTNTSAAGYGNYLLYGVQTNPQGWLVNLSGSSSSFTINASGTAAFSGTTTAPCFSVDGITCIGNTSGYWLDNGVNLVATGSEGIIATATPSYMATGTEIGDIAGGTYTIFDTKYFPLIGINVPVINWSGGIGGIQGALNIYDGGILSPSLNFTNSSGTYADSIVWSPTDRTFTFSTNTIIEVQSSGTVSNALTLYNHFPFAAVQNNSGQSLTFKDDVCGNPVCFGSIEANIAQISGIVTNRNSSAWAGDMTFGTASGSLSSIERMRITSEGDVGIGFTSWSHFYKLAVYGNLYDTYENIQSSTPTIALQSGGGYATKIWMDTVNYRVNFDRPITTPALFLPDTTDQNTGVIWQGGLPIMFSYGLGNFFLGTGAGNFSLSTTSAVNNTGIGHLTLQSLTTGAYNTAVGEGTMHALTTGKYNTGVGGDFNLYNLTTGWGNACNGYECMVHTDTGSYNVGMGYSACDDNTGGNYNTCIGYNSGSAANQNNAEASDTYDIFLGDNSGRSVPSSTILTNAIAIGRYAYVGGSNMMALGGTGSYALKVGIGVDTPTTTLDIKGTMRAVVASSTLTNCDSSNLGAIIYATSDDNFYGCRLSGWDRL